MDRPIIQWMGDEDTNSSSREGHTPICIVNHISAGTMYSMDQWFTDPGNEVSSAHFGVARDGRIHQYVKIERMAWANGLNVASDLRAATAPIVFDKKMNPNLYSVSIEHEGYDGDLTEEQFQASVWLHRYIQRYVKEHWGKDFPLDEYHVIGHCQINKIAKPNCPGPKFPWGRLYEALKEEEVDMEQIEELKAAVAELQGQLAAFNHLLKMPEVPAWAQCAVDTAVAKGLIDSPEGGSYDFYRTLMVLHRKGVI